MGSNSKSPNRICMILSNVEILKGIAEKSFSISKLSGLDPTKSPFNTSAVDLTLSSEIVVPKFEVPIQLDLRKSGIAKLLSQNSKSIIITDEQPFLLKNGELVLGKTNESVAFPLAGGEFCYSARVEGRSS